MKKIYLFMLMAVGLLISTTVWANLPERPTQPAEPQGPVMRDMPQAAAPQVIDGVEMPNPEAPKAIELNMPEHQTPHELRQSQVVDLTNMQKKEMPAKAPQKMLRSKADQVNLQPKQEQPMVEEPAEETIEEEVVEPMPNRAPMEETGAAKIGETKYATLQGAIDAAPAGATVTLADNITAEKNIIINKNLTLDFQGFIIRPLQEGTTSTSSLGEGDFVVKVTNNATVTMTGTPTTSTYSLYGKSGNYQNLVVDAGSMVSLGGTMQVFYGTNIINGTLEVKDQMKMKNANEVSGTLIITNYNTFSSSYAVKLLNGATLTSNKTEATVRVEVAADNSASINIANGCTLTLPSSSKINGNLTVTGGKLVIDGGSDFECGGTIKGANTTIELKEGSYFTLAAYENVKGLLQAGYVFTAYKSYGTIYSDYKQVVPAEAQIGADGYTLADAIAACQSGQEVVLIKAVTMQDATISNDATIDLNGFDLSLEGIEISGNLLFKNTKSTNNVVTIGDYTWSAKKSKISSSVKTTGAHVQISYAEGSYVFFTEDALSKSSNIPTESVFSTTDADYPVMVAVGYEAEASINGKNYVKLEYAIDAAQEGETVTLLKDVTVQDASVSKDAVIDLNGFNLSIEGTVIKGDLVFKNSKTTDNVITTIGDSYGYYSQISGSVTTTGDHVQINYAEGSYVFFTEDALSKSSDIPTESVFSTTDADYPVMVAVGATAVASVNGRKYVALQYAVKSAQAGDVVILLTDMRPTAAIVIDKDITLNLNGYTIDAQAYWDSYNEIYYFNDPNYEQCVIKIEADVRIIGDGTSNSAIWAPYYGYSDKIGKYYTLTALCVPSGSLTLENVELLASKRAIEANSILTINDETKIISYNEAAIFANGSNSNIIVNNGTITGYSFGIYGTNCNIEVNEGTIENTEEQGVAIYLTGATKILLNNGNFISPWYSFYSENYTCELNILGGRFNNDIYNPGKTTISGGRIGGYLRAYNYDVTGYKPIITGGIFDSKNVYKVYNNAWTLVEYTNSGYHWVESSITEDDVQKTVYEAVKDPDKVARVGKTKYEHLSDAITAAQVDDVVYLLKDITGDVTINKNITLNIASYNIAGTLTASDATVMVDGKGTINALSGDVKIIRAFTKVDPTNFLAEGSAFEGPNDNLYRVYPEKVAKMVVGGQETFYSTVEAAFDALPENSTPATITLLADEYMEYVGQPNEVAQFHNVTLDLNGHVIYGTNNYGSSSSAVITNRGTLTVKDGSAAGTGAIYNAHTNPEDWAAMGKEYPAHAYNIFSNYGTLTIESGRFESSVQPTSTAKSQGYASYVVDNYGCATLIVNGGTLYNFNTQAIRQFCQSTTCSNDVIINGGEVIGYYGVWVQLPSNNTDAPLASFTMNGGTLSDPWGHTAFYDYSYGQSHDNVSVNINGGTINGRVFLYTSGNGENLSITGGTFTFDPVVKWQTVTSKNGDKLANTITGGKYLSAYPFEANQTDEFEYYVADGYCVTSSKEGDLHWKTVGPCEEKKIDENTTITNPDEYKPSDVLIIDGTSGTEQSPVTVTIGDDKGTPIEVNVNSIQGDGEAQIVVKDGATLNVGNGGLVSENDKLVFVKVEAGGKMTIGNGGLDQKGQQYPIIVENDGSKSGVYMVSPDAQSPASDTEYDITKPEATVRVYTRAYMTATSEHWQHFACPVQTGIALGGGNTTVKMVPLNVTDDDPVLTVINNWNYETDKWEIMPVNGSDEYFGNEGWKTNVTMKPFYAYNLLNNSRPTDGGITYEFHGNLVGNEDMQLIFPEHGFCIFGNSYTAPIDLSVLFDKVTTDIQEGNIDPCVYIYNSKDDRFESVNALDLWLQEIGFDDAAFTQIPPQQAFIMNLTNGTTGATTVDYRKAVWGNKQSNLNVPIRAPKAMGNDFTNIVRIAISDAQSTDIATLVEGYEYDETYNYGADAQKYMENHNFNLYATTEVGQLAMVADNNIEGTLLTLQTGKAMEYTLSFTNVYGSDYKLIDLLSGTEIQMIEGNQYTFTAQPNSVETRFQVVAAAKAPTNIDKVQNTKEAKGVYTILGQQVSDKIDINKLNQGVYIIDGIKVVK